MIIYLLIGLSLWKKMLINFRSKLLISNVHPVESINGLKLWKFLMKGVYNCHMCILMKNNSCSIGIEPTTSKEAISLIARSEIPATWPSRYLCHFGYSSYTYNHFNASLMLSPIYYWYVLRAISKKGKNTDYFYS